MLALVITLLVTFGVVVSASPAAFPKPTPAPNLNDNVLQKRDSCTFSGSDGAASASASQTECATIVLSALTVPSGTTLDLSNLNDDTTVIFEGETSWEYAEWDGPLLQIKGTRITIEGASGSALDGNGAQYWDGEGGSGGVTKPKFFYAHDLTDSTISNLRIQNAPKNAVSISGVDGLTITDMTIDDSAGDELGKNTDCFNIGESTNVVIDGAQCYNQDDCVAVNSGTDITFQNGLCSGGHGLSIGSVGGRDNNDVATVTFKDSEITKSVNGIRIKTIENETGSVTGVTYSGITLSDISRFGIIVEQNYDGGDLDGGTPTSGVPITDLTIENIDGAGGVDSDGYNIVIVCGSTGCSDWTWSDVTVTGGEDYSDCQGEPSGISCSTQIEVTCAGEMGRISRPSRRPSESTPLLIKLTLAA